MPQTRRRPSLGGWSVEEATDALGGQYYEGRALSLHRRSEVQSSQDFECLSGAEEIPKDGGGDSRAFTALQDVLHAAFQSCRCKRANGDFHERPA